MNTKEEQNRKDYKEIEIEIERNKMKDGKCNTLY